MPEDGQKPVQRGVAPGLKGGYRMDDATDVEPSDDAAGVSADTPATEVTPEAEAPTPNDVARALGARPSREEELEAELARLQQERQAVVLERRRQALQTSFNLAPEDVAVFFTDADEAMWEARALRLAEMGRRPLKNGNVARKEGNTPGSPRHEPGLREFSRELFGSGDPFWD